MRTRELVEKLRARFDDVVFIWVKFSKAVAHKDKGTVELEGVLEVDTGGSILCGGLVIRTECSFINAIYSLHLGAVIHSAIVEHRVLIYAHYRYGAITYYLYVPCKFTNVDISKFEPVAKAGEKCPYENTYVCPLHKGTNGQR